MNVVIRQIFAFLALAWLVAGASAAAAPAPDAPNPDAPNPDAPNPDAPNPEWPTWKAAWSAWSRGDAAAAWALLADADDAASWAVRARMLESTGDAAGAYAAWGEATARAPDAASFWQGRARAAFALDRFEDARDALSRLQGADPEMARSDDTTLMAARVERRLGRPDRALSWLPRAVDRPSRWVNERERALALAELGLSVAVEPLARRFGDEQARVEDVLVLARLLWDRGAGPASVELLQAARWHWPGHAALLSATAFAAADTGDYAEAARLYDALGEFEMAAPFWSRAQRLERGLRSADQIGDACRRIRLRIALLADASRFDRALAHAAQWKACAPDSAVALRLGWASARVGQYRQALDWLATVSTPEHRALAKSLADTVRDCQSHPLGCP